MPVPSGYGASCLDYIGSVKVGENEGQAFAIEAKRPGKEPTPRQRGTMSAMAIGGMSVFVIDGDLGCGELDAWLRCAIGGRST